MYRAFLIPDTMPMRAKPLGEANLFTDARALILGHARAELGESAQLEEMEDPDGPGWDFLAHAPGRFGSLQFTIECDF